MKKVLITIISTLFVTQSLLALSADELISWGFYDPALPDFLSGWEDNRLDGSHGSSLPSQYSGVTKNSEELIYSGKVQADCLSFGPYFSQNGSSTAAIGNIEIEAQFIPDTYDTCRKRNWTKKCISWDTHDYPYGFTVDMIARDQNENLLPSTTGPISYQWNEANGSKLIELGRVENKNGGLFGIEVRVCNLYGGSVDFKVKKATILFMWNN